jgi:hypothetical protein
MSERKKGIAARTLGQFSPSLLSFRSVAAATALAPAICSASQLAGGSFPLGSSFLQLLPVLATCWTSWLTSLNLWHVVIIDKAND